MFDYCGGFRVIRSTKPNESRLRRPLEISVVGGCGHVALPMSLSLSSVGSQVFAVDNSTGAMEKVSSGISPFWGLPQ